MELFSAGEPRWLGVQFNRPGELEQRRILLVSVPYALKAVDADTLGGRPASAYALAETGSGEGRPGALEPLHSAGGETGSAPAPKTAQPKAVSGSTNCIGLFTSNSDIGCSAMWQPFTGAIGVNTTAPTNNLTVDQGGAASQSNSGVAVRYAGNRSVFFEGGDSAGYLYNFGNGGWYFYTNGAASQTMALSIKNNGYVGVGTGSPSYPLDVVGPIRSAAGGFIFPDGTTQTTAAGSGGGASPWTLAGGNLYYNGGNVGIGNSTPRKVLTLGSRSIFNSEGVLSLNTCNSNCGGNREWQAGVGYSSFGDENFHIRDAQMSASALTIAENTGNLGIGTAAPAAKLDVAGDINFSGALQYQGVRTLQVNVSSGNLAAGYGALTVNTTGTNNTAAGFRALAFNSSGSGNTAEGGYALYSNTTGSFNTAVGYGVLQSLTAGSYSTGIGYNALGNDNGAGYNTASGALSLSANTIGQDNTATGYSSLWSNTIGSQNAAYGYQSLLSNVAGNNNTAVGFSALANSTGSGNIALGYQGGLAISGGSNNIDIGNLGNAADGVSGGGVIRIGAAGAQTSFFAAGIRGVTTGSNNAVPVVIDSNGQLGTISSSRRFKEDIHDMGDASRNLMRLRPVTFRYKQPFADGSKPVQYGLIAEEVAQIYPELVARSADGSIETVKYQLLDSMLLNEIQRQEARIQAQKDEILALREETAGQNRQIQELQQRLAKLEAALESRVR